jgi:DNA repair photolyase
LEKNICKTILTKSKLPGIDYVYNPYIGCTHACTYCYAKFISKFNGHENEVWGKYITYKENAIEILTKDILKIKKSEKIFLGSVTDVYQPIEKKLELTRQALEIFKQNQSNVNILTKSNLVIRDIDILKNMTKVEVGISLGCSNDEFVNVIEPGAKKVSERINALKTLKEANIATYVFMSPIIPYVTKLEDNFKNISPYVDYVMGETLNLKRVDMKVLRESIGKLFNEEKVNKIIKTCTDEKYLFAVKSEFYRLCKKYGVENRGFFIH